MPEEVRDVVVVVEVNTNYRTIWEKYDDLEKAEEGIREIRERLEATND